MFGIKDEQGMIKVHDHNAFKNNKVEFEFELFQVDQTKVLNSRDEQ